MAPGPDLLERFLKINGDMRAQEQPALADLRFKTEEKMLWNGPFIHWGKEESQFADVRNYIYNGQKVDQQVHLGFDLSDVQNVPGQCGQRRPRGPCGGPRDLRQLHGGGPRLRAAIDLRAPERDRREARRHGEEGADDGHRGATGLAGGDHLHFSMQIDGVQINPREWWDEHWIQDRILSKLEPDRAAAITATTVRPSTRRPKSRRKSWRRRSGDAPFLEIQP